MERMGRATPVILGLLLGLVTSVNAQVLDTATMQVVISIPQSLWVNINVSKLVFEEADFDTTKDAILLEEGILATKPSAVRVRVGGNVGHAVYVSSFGDSFVGPHGVRLSSSQMAYRRATASEEAPWYELNPKGSIVEPIYIQRTAGRNTFDMDYRLLATWLDAPGTYEGTIIYTVVPLGS